MRVSSVARRLSDARWPNSSAARCDGDGFVIHELAISLPSLALPTSLVVAIGRAGFIRGEHIKPGAVVIDVGMNKVSDVSEVRSLFGEDAEKRLEVVEKRGFLSLVMCIRRRPRRLPEC